MTLARRSSTRQQQSTVMPTNTTLMAQDSPGVPSAYGDTNSGSITQPLEDSTSAATAEEDEEMQDKISDDESSDDNAVTRCPCGKEKLPYYFSNGNDDNDEGLMVQCDQCEVWQHCKCVGLEEEKDIPDQYYCEQCRPENHKAVKTTHGRRYKRFYNSLGFAPGTVQDHQQTTKPTKRRKKAPEVSTPRKSSRQTSTKRMNTTSAVSQTGPNGTTTQSLSPIPSDSTDTEGGWLSNGKSSATLVAVSDRSSMTDVDETITTTTTATATTTSKRPRRSVYSPVTDSLIAPSSDSPSPTLTRRKKPTSHPTAATATTAPVIITTTTSTTSSSSSSNTHVPTSSPSSSSTPHAVTSPSTGTKRTSSSSSSSSSTAMPSPSRNAQGRFYKNAMDSRASTPHPTTATTITTPFSTSPTSIRGDEATSYWNEDGLPQREGSPPAKIKYPNSKMTMADMNKRAKQIMDHLDKIKSTLQQQQQTENGAHATTTTTTAAAAAATIGNDKTTGTISKSAVNESQQVQQDDPPPPPPMNLVTTSQPMQDDDDDDEQQRPRSLSTCSVSSSISSASTLPLLLDDDDSSFQSSLLLSTSPTSPLPLDKLFDRNNGDDDNQQQQQQQQQESSLDMMDRVYRELLKFQRKFGGVLQVQQASSVR
ncbi:unnamed protein product [Absidia cylindrospora]